MSKKNMRKKSLETGQEWIADRLKNGEVAQRGDYVFSIIHKEEYSEIDGEFELTERCRWLGRKVNVRPNSACNQVFWFDENGHSVFDEDVDARFVLRRKRYGKPLYRYIEETESYRNRK